MAARTLAIPPGDGGTEATIAVMRQLIEDGKKDPVVRELALQILSRARVPSFDSLGEVRAIYEAIGRNVKFRRDIRGKETLHAAREIIRLQAGDCDDFVILTCSILETIGHPTRIVTVAGDADAPDVFTHVYPETCVDGKWIPVDNARRRPMFGAAPRNVFRKRLWDSSSPEFEDLQALAGVGTRTTPGRLPSAWSPTAIPQFRFLHTGLGAPSRGRRTLGAPARSYGAPMGLGRYGARALHGALGDDVTQLETEAPQLMVGAADIIAASRAAPTNLVPTTNPTSMNPFGTASLPSLLPGAGSGSLGGSNTTTLLLVGGLALAAVFVFMKGRS